MTPRERLMTVLEGGIPDCVPVSPDFSNMIPARLTGKPFWDLYLYNDPPIWQAYIDAAKRFNIDSLMDGYFWLSFPDEQNCVPWQRLPATPNSKNKSSPIANGSDSSSSKTPNASSSSVHALKIANASGNLASASITSPIHLPNGFPLQKSACPISPRDSSRSKTLNPSIMAPRVCAGKAAYGRPGSRRRIPRLLSNPLLRAGYLRLLRPPRTSRLLARYIHRTRRTKIRQHYENGCQTRLPLRRRLGDTCLSDRRYLPSACLPRRQTRHRPCLISGPPHSHPFLRP